MRVSVLIVIALAGVATADSPTLRLTHEPPPRHLRMRPRTAATPTPEPPKPDVSADAKADDDAADKAVAANNDAMTLRDLRRPISVRFNLGYVVDGTALSSNSPDPACASNMPTTCTLNINQQVIHSEETARLRAYALGEGYFSSRGVLYPSLSTYFATKFQIARRETGVSATDGHSEPVAPPVATWFEHSGIEPRQLWAEVKDFLPDARLAPLRVRAGEIYVYGPWVLHMYGALAAWEGKLLRASAYGGSRVPDFTDAFSTKNRSGIAGSSVNFDLRNLKTSVPFAIGIELLKFTALPTTSNKDATANAANHAALQLDWRPRKDIALISRFRALDGALANEYVQLRTRFKQVSNIVIDYNHRNHTDWIWDPSLTTAVFDPLAPKRYLDLGPTAPRSLVSGRAGTLIKENVDVLVRGALAWDTADTAEHKSTFAASYFELGGAVELRLRRTMGLGLSALTRQTQRDATVTREINDIPNVIDAIPIHYSNEMGERGFTELGTTLRLSLGARRLSALVEVFGRRTRYALDYCEAIMMNPDGTYESCNSALDTGLKTQDIRGGGRFTLDAWVGNGLRLFASYELSSKIELQREFTGFKSLRLMMEGVY